MNQLRYDNEILDCYKDFIHNILIQSNLVKQIFISFGQFQGIFLYGCNNYDL